VTGAAAKRVRAAGGEQTSQDTEGSTAGGRKRDHAELDDQPGAVTGAAAKRVRPAGGEQTSSAPPYLPTEAQLDQLASLGLMPQQPWVTGTGLVQAVRDAAGEDLAAALGTTVEALTDRDIGAELRNRFLAAFDRAPVAFAILGITAANRDLLGHALANPARWDTLPGDRVLLMIANLFGINLQVIDEQGALVAMLALTVTCACVRHHVVDGPCPLPPTERHRQRGAGYIHTVGCDGT